MIGAVVSTRMRICLLATNAFVHDPRARALHASLTQAGHEVHVVAGGDQPPDAPPHSTFVPTRRPVGAGLAGRVLRRLQPEGLRQRVYHRSLVDAARATGAQLFYPTSLHAVPLAVEAAGEDAAVVRDPAWPHAGERDLVALAPHHPDAAPPVNAGLAFHTPADQRQPNAPEPRRYAGRKILLAYRKTDSNPGKYLEAALERAGVEVLRETRRVDTTQLPADLDAVVFVEGPYPALDVVGPPFDVPVLFWIHHGEHHLAANLRLATRYRADHLLLAHSWHLAHRFGLPVTRFPFGVPVELFDGSRPWDQRRYDVAMVGAHLREGGPYQRRQELVRRSEEALGADRCAFLENVPAEEMARAYEDSRIVLNEGGTRHHPITMRVFEAFSAGALLLTEPVPGLDLLFQPGRDYVHLEDPVEEHVQRLLEHPDAASVAAHGAQRGLGHHTYDHRIDEVMAVVDATTPGRRPDDPRPPSGTFSAVLFDDVEVQRIVQHGVDELVDEHGDREIWRAEDVPERLVPGAFEAVCLRADDVRAHRDLLRSARRFLYLRGELRGLEDHLAAEAPDATVTEEAGLVRVDLHADSYSIKPHEVVDG